MLLIVELQSIFKWLTVYVKHKQLRTKINSVSETSAPKNINSGILQVYNPLLLALYAARVARRIVDMPML